VASHPNVGTWVREFLYDSPYFEMTIVCDLHTHMALYTFYQTSPTDATPVPQTTTSPPQLRHHLVLTDRPFAGAEALIDERES
jgi:hypothetical protein